MFKIRDDVDLKELEKFGFEYEEEDIKILESIIKINNDYLKGVENQTINQKEIKALEHILLDYKRVLKENEELNNRCRNLDKEAQGYLEELAGDDTLSTRTMKQLQKENEELKNAINVVNKEKADWIRAYQEEKDKQIKLLKSSIPIQKIKDKIEEEKLPLVIVGGRRNKRTLEYGIKLGRRQALQKLLEGRK